MNITASPIANIAAIRPIVTLTPTPNGKAKIKFKKF